MATDAYRGPEEDVGFLFKILTDKMRRHADENLGRIGLTYSQFRVLASINCHGGSMTQREIERELMVSHPTVAGLVSRLDEAGFVECRTDERDRRNKIVSLTQKSLTIRETLERGRRKNEEILLKGVSDHERHELDRIMRKILYNLEDAEQCHTAL